jgi:hypothetical protein
MTPPSDVNDALNLAASLSRSDFDDQSGQGTEVLETVCDFLRDGADPHRVIPAMFALLERLDGVDLGSPGPVVHLLESFEQLYEGDLKKSLERHPTPLTVWMVNRLLNRSSDGREAWLQLLERAAHHPRASAETAADAMDFHAFQTDGR